MLSDVAERAGVHPGTASRALNPATRSLVKPATAERVLKAARDLGYQVNTMARGLRTKRSMTVGVLIPDLANPLFPPIVRGMEEVLHAAGMVPLIANTDSASPAVTQVLAALESHHPDGWLVASAFRDDPVVRGLVARRNPVILVSRTMDEVLTSSVVCDDEATARLAVEHLVGLGHRSIAHLGGPVRTSNGILRMRAYRAALAEHDITPAPEHAVHLPAFTFAAGREAMARMLTMGEHPTAVVAGNDLIALGALDSLRAAGFSCPQDVSIVGINDMPMAANTSPALTTVHLPTHQMGAQAATMLIAQLDNPARSIASVRLHPTLVVRDTTSTPSNGSARRA